MAALMYRVNNYRWKAGFLQKRVLFLWRNVCPCSNWIDAAWAINCLNGLHQRSTFTST